MSSAAPFAAIPVPDADEARDNAAFAALLAALARPGSVQRLPGPGAGAIAQALLDRECRAFAEDAGLQAVILRTGAVLSSPEDARHVFMVLDGPDAPDRLARLHTGSPLYPDDGATVIAPAILGAGAALRLSGPGIEREQVIRLGGLNPAIWATRAALCAYPLGVEMILIDGDRLTALPRSTHVVAL